MAQVREKERCPGTGAYARDLARNPSGSCPVCGHWSRLTKSGCIRSHKRVVPAPPPKHQRNVKLDGLTNAEIQDLARILRVHFGGTSEGLDHLDLRGLFEEERKARKLRR